ncbi:hypothetical protein Dda_4061 [Drechslerella dactyloides]|uniref:NACHT domain-containing protein n=1 Tax=Drechslerella dactyloides TaxID=74499 RepID=A0AAD6J3E1_DREDA|nr:hypothetical protein Dda_4061 [Drechslerella dactyloides]
MEAIAAFSFAVNVLAVVDLGIKVASAYKEGGIVDSSRLRDHASGLENLCNEITSNSLCKAVVASQALQKELAAFRPGGSKVKLIMISVKNIFTNKIENLERDLRKIQSDLDTRLLVSLRQKIDFSSVELSEHYKALDVSVQKLLKEFYIHNGSITSLIRTENEATRNIISAELGSWKDIWDSKEVNDRRERFLESLTPGKPFTREYEIESEHDGTFKWILYDGSKEKPSTFTIWLRKNNDIFWIQGKPGSGKSTLMKFISRSGDVFKSLESWAKPRNPLMIRFYFWLADTTGMQNSLKGFLRSCLYQLLRANWLDELKELVQDVSRKVAAQTPLLFLIDGLDECKGNDLKGMIDMMILLDSNPDTKFCVSSRPEPRIQTRLKGTHRLKVEDYTRGDIKIFVNEGIKLAQEHNDFNDTVGGLKRVISRIVDQSDGVFLWAIIVTRDVTSGIENSDSLKQLLQRVEILPTDLVELYESMLKRLGKIGNSTRVKPLRTSASFWIGDIPQSRPWGTMMICPGRLDWGNS